MITSEIIHDVCLLLNKFDVSSETSSIIKRLLLVERLRDLVDMENESVKALRDIKDTLENIQYDDFECIDRIIEVFDSLDISIEYRHEF